MDMVVLLQLPVELNTGGLHMYAYASSYGSKRRQSARVWVGDLFVGGAKEEAAMWLTAGQ